MSETITIKVDTTWRRFFPDTENFFSFSNEGPIEIYVRESVVQPDIKERGFLYFPGERGSGEVKEAGFWVRSKRDSSTFHYSVVLPGSLSGLVLHLDASDMSTIIESGGLVNEWSDKSDQGNNFTQTGGSRPETNSHTINGKNVIHFNGVPENLTMPFNASLNPAEFSTFIVCETEGGVGFRSLISSRDTVLATGYDIRINDIHWESTFGNDSAFFPTNEVTNIIDNVAILMRVECTSTSQRLFINDVASGTANANPFTPNVTKLSRVGAGQTIDDAALFFDGDIGEIAMYNRILSSDEQGAITAYLSARWGIAL